MCVSSRWHPTTPHVFWRIVATCEKVTVNAVVVTLVVDVVVEIVVGIVVVEIVVGIVVVETVVGVLVVVTVVGVLVVVTVVGVLVVVTVVGVLVVVTVVGVLVVVTVVGVLVVVTVVGVLVVGADVVATVVVGTVVVDPGVTGPPPPHAIATIKRDVARARSHSGRMRRIPIGLQLTGWWSLDAPDLTTVAGSHRPAAGASWYTSTRKALISDGELTNSSLRVTRGVRMSSPGIRSRILPQV